MISKEKEAVLTYYNKGLAAYNERKWDEAIQAFEAALKIDPGDGPSEIYLERSRNYRASPPPADWDGVFVMTTK